LINSNEFAPRNHRSAPFAPIFIALRSLIGYVAFKTIHSEMLVKVVRGYI